MDSTEQNWKELVSNSRDMVGIHNPEGQFLWVSNAVEDLLGYQPENIVGLSPYDLMHEKDIASIKSNTHEPLLNNLFSKQEFTMRLQHKNGHYVWIETLARISKSDKNGNVKEIQSYSRDITIKNKLIDRLENTTKRYKQAQSIASIGSWELDHRNNKIIWSDEVYHIFGLNKDAFEPTYEKFLEMVHPEDRDKIHSTFADSVNKQTKYDIRHRICKPDGEVRVVKECGSTKYDKWGEPKISHGTVQDITELHEVQQKVMKSEKKFRELWNLSPDALITVDEDGIINECNRQVERILGYRCEQLKGEKLEMLVPDASKKRHVGHRKEFFKSRETRPMGQGLKLSALHKNRDKIPVEICLSHHDFDDERVVLAAIRDVTERRKATNALARERRKLADALRGGDLGTWEWNVITGEIQVNERWAQMLGFSYDRMSQISATTFQKLVHPDDFWRVKRKLAEHFSGQKQIYECEFRLQHNEGYWVWVQSKGKISAWDENNNPKLITGTHQDITNKKKAVQLVTKKRKQLRLLIDSLPVLITYLDSDLKYVLANKEYAKWYKTTVNKIEGSFAYNFVADHIMEKVGGWR